MSPIRIALVLCALSLCACFPATVNPALKADIDRRAQSLAPGSQLYPAAALESPMPLAVGQWIELAMVDQKGQRSFYSYKVVGEEAGAFWVETLSESYTGKTATRMLADFGDRQHLEQVNVKALKTRSDDGAVQEYPSAMLPLLKPVWEPLLQAFTVDLQQSAREDVTVPAGRFEQAFKKRAQASFGNLQQTTDSWFHPAVPINALVRSVGVDKPGSVELVAFGTEGARSAF